MERILSAKDKFLLNHPFYKDWVEGKLCKDDLAVYSAEYLYFIRDILPESWNRLGYYDVFHEEKEHAFLWEEFGKSVDYDPTNHPRTKSMQTLRRLFDDFKYDRPSLVGFVFAFEHQQPEISKSKLEGLNRWFNVDDKGKRYFEEHSKGTHEVEILEKEIMNMSDEEFVRCKDAFEMTVHTLWNLLTDIQKITSEKRKINVK